VRDHKGSGEKLETKNAILGSVLEVGGREGIVPALFESLVNFPKDFDEIRTCAATGVEDVDVFVGEAIGEVELSAEHGVDPGDHILNDFGWRVPDAKLLSELRVKGMQEGLVKVLNGVALLELGEEGGTIDSIEKRGAPIEDFREV